LAFSFLYPPFFLFKFKNRFGLSDWHDTRIATQPPAEIQAEFLGKACEMMNRLAFVERYAYFPPFPYTSHESWAHMYEEDGRITPVGEVYRTVK